MRVAILAVLAACAAPAPTSTPVVPVPPVAAPAAPTTGRVETQTFHTDALGVDKHVTIYLPAGYDASPAKKWPVFYYLNGLGGGETDWVGAGHLDKTADAMHLGAIVVMPDGDNNFYIDSAMAEDYDGCMKTGAGMFSPRQPHESTCVHASKYATYIVEDLLKWVDGHYRTIATRDGRAIAGLSMGGYGALELGMRFTDRFSAAASHSGVDALLYESPYPYPTGHPELVKTLADVSKWGAGGGPLTAWIRAVFGADRETWVALDPIALAGKLEPGKLAIYLDCGTEDDFNLNNAAAYLHDVLLARKIDHAFFLGPGRHDFDFWSARLPFSLAFLRDHTTAAR